jgi:hypothetical protein
MKTLKSKRLGVVGIAAYALCCMLPLAGLVVGLTALVSLGVWVEKATSLLGGFAFVAFLILKLKEVKDYKTDRAANATNCTTCTTDFSCNPTSSSLAKVTSMLNP